MTNQPAEPTFTLRARDPFAPLLIRIWCLLTGSWTGEKMAEPLVSAQQTANEMENWRRDNVLTDG